MEKATTRRGALMSLAKATAGVTALGVACSVSQCTSPAHGAVIDRSAWNSAKERHRLTLLVRDQFDRDVLAPSAHRHTTLRESFGPYGQPLTPDQRAQLDALGHNKDQARYDELHETNLEAYEAMLRFPAPDIAALAYKLEQIQAQEMYGLEHGDSVQIMETLIADARRLAGKEA